MREKVIFKISLWVLLSCITFQVAFAKEPIRWVFTDYPPANYQAENGEYTGFLYDITIEAFEKRLGIPVEIAIFPWKRCQILVQNGAYDVLLTIPTPERLTFTHATEEPVWVKKRIVYTYAGHPELDEMQRIRGLEDIKEKGYVVISYLGNGWMETAVEKSGISVKYATGVDGMYKMLAAKRGDIIIEESRLAHPSIKDLGLESTILATEGIGAESNFHLLIGKKSQYATILEPLNTVIREMWLDGTIAGIMAEYNL